MKKMLSIILCLAMVMALASSAFAAGIPLKPGTGTGGGIVKPGAGDVRPGAGTVEKPGTGDNAETPDTGDNAGGSSSEVAPGGSSSEVAPGGSSSEVAPGTGDNKDDTTDTPAGGGSSEVAPGTGDNKDDTTDTPAKPEELPAKTFTVGEKSFTAEGGKWLYNTEFTKGQTASYKMIILDKKFTGTFETNEYGAVVVVNKYGELVKIYDGANIAFWNLEGKAATTTVTKANFASLAFSELEDGELMIIFPNDGANAAGSPRKFALDLRPNITPGLFGLVTTLTGFTWEVRQPTGGDDVVDPPVDPPVDPKPETPPTGDSTVVFFALMALSMTALVVLVSKKRAF